MPQVNVSLVHVLVAAIAAMIIGSLWYSKILFGKEWQALVGLKDSDMKAGASKAMVTAAVAALITAYVLAHIVVYANAKTWMDGAVTGFWIWLGFVATMLVSGAAFEDRPMKLTLINAGNQLVALVVMGAILAGWV